MIRQLLQRDTIAVPEDLADLLARVFVWIVWLGMMLVAIGCFVTYGRNIPIAEDWLFVEPLTGHEPNLLGWLWSQNSEHRNFVPRLILLGLLKATHGDFRAGMLVNILIIGVLAAAMILVARRLRNGRTRLVDAFFPLALLHLGNWENLFWSWQLTQVVPMILTGVLLLALVLPNALTTPGTASVAGLSLVLLPLSGANGLLLVPLLACWFSYCGTLQWRAAKTATRQRWIGGWLIGSAILALGFTGFYFVGFERSPWNPPSPGLIASLTTAVQFLALGFGPAVRNNWLLSAIAALAIFLPSGYILVLGVLRRRGMERQRAVGLLVFSLSLAGFVLAMGWGRAGLIAVDGVWPLRYVLLSAPTLCSAFFIWELYGSTRQRAIVQTGLLLGMGLLLPLNTTSGLEWRDWYRQGTNAIDRDLTTGTPLNVLAERHRDFLIHWWEPAQLADNIQMLHDAGFGPFTRVQEPPTTASTPAPAAITTPTAAPLEGQQAPGLEIRYYLPQADEVVLVWGINDWQAVPEDTRPTGTVVKDRLMYTPMSLVDGVFIARIKAPAGTTIDYVFQITMAYGSAVDIWDPNGDPNEDYHSVAQPGGLAEITATVSLDQASARIAALGARLLPAALLLLMFTGVAASVSLTGNRLARKPA